MDRFTHCGIFAASADTEFNRHVAGPSIEELEAMESASSGFTNDELDAWWADELQARASDAEAA